MIVEATQNLEGCSLCGYTGNVTIKDKPFDIEVPEGTNSFFTETLERVSSEDVTSQPQEFSCVCVERRRLRMQSFRPLIDRCDLKLYNKMRFDNFLPQNKTQAHAFKYVTHLFSGWYLYGSYGVGKTHLMAAMVNDLNSKNVPAVIFTEKDLMKIMGFVRSQEMETLQKLLERVRYLVIDDLGTEWQTQPVRAKIYQLIDKRYLLAQSHQGYTSFTSQIPFDKLTDKYDGRVVDRILGMTMQAVITGESMRKKPQVKYHEE